MNSLYTSLGWIQGVGRGLPLTSPPAPGNCKKFSKLSGKFFFFQLEGVDLPHPLLRALQNPRVVAPVWINRAPVKDTFFSTLGRRCLIKTSRFKYSAYVKCIQFWCQIFIFSNLWGTLRCPPQTPCSNRMLYLKSDS